MTFIREILCLGIECLDTLDFSFLEILDILFFQNNSTLFIDFLCKFFCKIYTKI